MTDLKDLPPLRDVVRRYELAAKKSLGQNFLYDLNLTARIARAAEPLAEATIVEVGPGPGGLTRALLAQGARRLIAIEKDERCLPALAEIADRAEGRLTVVAADALACDFGAILRDAGVEGRVCVAANLPYNIAVPLLTGWVETEPWPPWFDRLTLMFQREVAERIVATPRERAAYGRLSVLCGWRTKARILFDVPASAFTPSPKVTSSVVELAPRAIPADCDPNVLSAVSQSAFGQRRKMLRQSLRSLKGLGYDIDAASLLREAGLDPTWRAEQLQVEDFVRVARLIASDQRRQPLRPQQPQPGPQK